MRCMICHGPVVFERTVFNATTPTTVRLCNPCATKVDVMKHLEGIKAAADHQAKNEAVASFLAAIDGASADAQQSSGG